MQHGKAVYFDGQSNRKRDVELGFGAGLDIVENGALADTWPYGEVRRADGPSTMLRLRCVAALPLARLEIDDEATRDVVVAHCASLDVDRGGPAQTRRIVLWSLAAVCSIVAVAVFGVPLLADRLVPILPRAFEQRFGEAADKQVRFIFGDKMCVAPDGQAAFTALVEQIRTAAGIEAPLQAQVLFSTVPNAFALPGGKVYLLDGLLQKAQSPDEIAGVLAHELGHVQHRDNMRLLLQTGGTAFLIGLLFGDVLGGGALIVATRHMLTASYSRDAETSADAFAVDVMHKLGRSPKPMGDLLLRVTGTQADKGVAMSIMSTHPLTESRVAMMKTEDRPNTGQELLSAAQWRALKSICRMR